MRDLRSAVSTALTGGFSKKGEVTWVRVNLNVTAPHLLATRCGRRERCRGREGRKGAECNGERERGAHLNHLIFVQIDTVRHSGGKRCHGNVFVQWLLFLLIILILGRRGVICGVVSSAAAVVRRRERRGSLRPARCGGGGGSCGVGELGRELALLRLVGSLLAGGHTSRLCVRE